MLQKLKTYRLLLVFCLILILITVGTSVSKIKNHKTNIYSKNGINTTMNKEVESVNEFTDNTHHSYDPDAKDVEFVFAYSDDDSTSSSADNANSDSIDIGLAEDEDYVAEQLELTPITEEDFKEIIAATQATDTDKKYQGYRLTDDLKEQVNNGTFLINEFENITTNYITIESLGVADDGEFLGRVIFEIPSQSTYKIEGWLVNNQVASFQIFQ